MFWHSFEQILSDIFERKYAFFAVFFAILLISYAFLVAIDFVPEKPEETEVVPMTTVSVETEVEPVEEVVAVDPLPTRIIIDAIDKDIKVLNPQSRDINLLDTALLDGVVRHPDSADLSMEGNMFLFGHSSYLPNVRNKNFQAFNGIQNLVWGDTIRVQSSDREYVYRVTKVYKTLASEATITLDNRKAKLTLATCNSFGSKDDRFVVEADLIESRSL